LGAKVRLLGEAGPVRGGRAEEEVEGRLVVLGPPDPLVLDLSDRVFVQTPRRDARDPSVGRGSIGRDLGPGRRGMRILVSEGLETQETEALRSTLGVDLVDVEV